MEMRVLHSLLRHRSATIATLALATVFTAAHATQLVSNGGFEVTGGTNKQIGYNTTVANWSTNGYNFVFASGAADSVGATSQYGNLQLWGPNNGSGNGLPASSPDGGNYIAADGAFQTGAITQSITGLIMGKATTVSFYWAGAQQSGFSGPTTEQWEVSLGTQTQDTAILNNLNHGFTGWQQTTFTFTPTATTETLSFLAIGTPNGVPPFSLLDGVSVTTVTPEPSSLALLITGLAGAGSFVRSRFKKNIV